MNKGIFFSLFVLFITFTLNAQTNRVVVGNGIRLPKDSIQSSLLISNLNSFLISAQKPNEENVFVSPPEKMETGILLEEINGIETNDTINLKPHLTNIEDLRNDSYLIQVSYMGVNKTIPVYKASFEFIAQKVGDRFLFSSPLKRNTKDWKTKTIKHLVFRYQNPIAKKVIEQYAKYTIEFDKKLKINNATEFYFCDDCYSMSQLLQLTGVQYKSDYNGFSLIMIEWVINGKDFNIFSQKMSRQEEFDPHDLFHQRASLAIPSEKRNHYMVCGCAYVYGGSWGISWEDIQHLFKTRMNYDENTDWLKLYYDRYNFGESQEKHLLVTQFVNALIIQKVEKEQGFSVVMELLSSGNMMKDKENFFRILEKVTGINEKNFNKEVGKLINNKMK